VLNSSSPRLSTKAKEEMFYIMLWISKRKIRRRIKARVLGKRRVRPRKKKRRRRSLKRKKRKLSLLISPLLKSTSSRMILSKLPLKN
jgi:hypothetical protein